MRKKLKWMLVLSSVALGASLYVGIARATPASGFTGTTIAMGRFEEIEVRNHVSFPESARSESEREAWRSVQKTKGPSDLYVQTNVWAPGGSTGWHTHPGHSLIIVTEGAVTAYEGHDPSCTPHVFTAGMTLVDPGGDHVHMLRNEGWVDARTIAVQLIPAGAMRRIDAPGPSGCPR
jgi:quercetin dioxygenase-like cupin family protein